MLYHAGLAWLPGGVAAEVEIEVRDGSIAAVRPGTQASPDARRLAGLAIPALANAHSHAFHRLLRARAEAPGDFWSWRRGMYELADRLDPDLYRDLATAVYVEMALAGIGSVGEFHYLHHAPGGRRYSDPNEMACALVQAAQAAGIRITLLDCLYVQAGLGGRPLEGPQARFGDPGWEPWAERLAALRPSATMRPGAAIHSVRAVDPGSMRGAAGWARGAGLPLHVHLSEQLAENHECIAATGVTPAVLLDRCGVLVEGATAVHGVHLDAADIALLAHRRTGVCACPTTERSLGDGVVPGRELADHGISLSLGSDSHAVVDLLEEARALEHAQRLDRMARGIHSPADLLTAATSGGTRALGWEGGALEAGAPADFAVLDLDSVRTAGAGDALTRAVYAATATDVTALIVGGREVVRDRVHVSGIDPARLLRDVAARL